MVEGFDPIDDDRVGRILFHEPDAAPRIGDAGGVEDDGDFGEVAKSAERGRGDALLSGALVEGRFEVPQGASEGRSAPADAGLERPRPGIRGQDRGEILIDPAPGAAGDLERAGSAEDEVPVGDPGGFRSPRTPSGQPILEPVIDQGIARIDIIVEDADEAEVGPLGVDRSSREPPGDRGDLVGLDDRIGDEREGAGLRAELAIGPRRLGIDREIIEEGGWSAEEGGVGESETYAD